MTLLRKADRSGGEKGLLSGRRPLCLADGVCGKSHISIICELELCARHDSSDVVLLYIFGERRRAFCQVPTGKNQISNDCMLRPSARPLHGP